MHLFHSGDRKQFPDSFMSETRRLWKVIHAKGVESRVQWKVKNKWVAQQKNRRRRKGDNFYFTYNPTRGLLASAPSISYSHSQDSARADGPWGAFLTRSGSAGWELCSQPRAQAASLSTDTPRQTAANIWLLYWFNLPFKGKDLKVNTNYLFLERLELQRFTQKGLE